MALIRICGSLRKLEFEAPELEPGESSQASIEFALETPLAPDESVHIPLGMRDGRLRAVIGVPKFVEKKAAESSAQEYLYRIGGLISELPPDSP
jgi:hypothetical protein